MSECQNCGAKSAGANLCGRCVSDLQVTLTSLATRTATNFANGYTRATAGFIELLEDAALGRTRLGESARRSSEFSRPALVKLTKHPTDSFKGSPSELGEDICALLIESTLAINSKLETLAITPGRSKVNTPALAMFLASHVNDIAKLDNAGTVCRSIHKAVDDIQHAINRPIPPRYCGPCPAVLEDDTTCDAILTADRKAEKVKCPQCETVHDIAQIETELWARIDEWLLTISEIHLVMEYFGHPIPASTIRRWKMENKLKPRGYRDGKPRYWPKDVRALRKRVSA